MKEISLFLGTIFIGFYLIFATGMPFSEPHAIQGGGWAIILIHFIVITIITLFLLKVVGSKVNNKYLLIIGVLWCFFAIVSACFSVLCISSGYVPEILIVPTCTFLYLSITYGVYSTINSEKNA